MLEGRFGLKINRTKTSVNQVSPDKAEALDFQGYRIRYAADLYGRGHSYLTAHPSPKAMGAERENIREISCPSNGCVPVQDLIGMVNRQLRGWAQYHSKGRPAQCFRRIEHLRFESPVLAPAKAQPTPLPTTGGEDMVAAYDRGPRLRATGG